MRSSTYMSQLDPKAADALCSVRPRTLVESAENRRLAVAAGFKPSSLTSWLEAMSARLSAI